MGIPSRHLLVPVMFAVLGAAGCRHSREAMGVSLGVLGLLAQAASTPPSAGNGCCELAEGSAQVEDPVDRPMTECELARGRWREANQAQDEVPPELRCMGDGAYPPATFARRPAASPGALPPPATAAEEEPAPPAPPQAPPSTPDML